MKWFTLRVILICLCIGIAENSQISREFEVDLFEEEDKKLPSNSRDNFISIDTENLNGGITTGLRLTSYKGREIYSFRGIPYVDMPSRFKRTAFYAKSDYDAELNATIMGEKCPQASRIKNSGETVAVGKEDCLFINVYTPNIPSKGRDLLPVMVFIHGGQNVRGDSSPYMPSRLLDEDVLLVTFNYRLGVLGFYSFGSDGNNPGNLALYDQNVALKWVNKYIADFGGDNGKVTLFGQDAGATSAMYQLITGKSKDLDEEHNEITLFHGVIAQSGSALDPMAFDNDGGATSREMAAALGCSGDNEANCMYNLSEDELALGADKLAEARNIHIPYLTPSIDGGIVENDPMTLVKEAEYENLPIMLGTCEQEGSFIFGEFYSHYLASENKDDDEEYLQFDMVPEMLTLAGIYDPLEFVAASLYDTYLDKVDRKNFSEMISGMIDMTGALFSKSGILEMAKLSYENYNRDNKVDLRATDIFLYSFEYKGEYSMFPVHVWGVDEEPEFTDEQIGVTRGDDLIYLLTLSSLQNEDEEITMERMVKMWANFASQENPTPVNGDLGVIWKPYSNQNQEYLSIGVELNSLEDYESRYTALVDEEERRDIPWQTITIPSPTPTTSTSQSNDTTTTTSHVTITNPTSETTSTTTPPSTTSLSPDNICSCDDLKDAEDARDAYMISMIVFIILFLITLIFALCSCCK